MNTSGKRGQEVSLTVSMTTKPIYMIVYWNPTELYTGKDSVDSRLYMSLDEASGRLEKLQSKCREKLTIAST